MYDINKILQTFDNDLKTRTPEERVSYLRSFGFAVQAPKGRTKQYRTNTENVKGLKGVIR